MDSGKKDKSKTQKSRISENSSLKKEASKLEKLKFKELNKNYFLVEVPWMNSWKSYIKGGLPPGVMRNSSLKGSSIHPRKNIKLGKDYITLNQDQWNFLKSIHGAEEPLVSTLEDLNEFSSPQQTERLNPALLQLPQTMITSLSPSASEVDLNLSGISEVSNISMCLPRPEPQLPEVKGDDTEPDIDNSDIESEPQPEEKFRPIRTVSTRNTSNLLSDTELGSLYVSKKLDLKKVRVGIENSQNYSFMNAGMQLLMCLEPFLKFIKNSVCEDPLETPTYNLIRGFMLNALWKKKGIIEGNFAFDIINSNLTEKEQFDTQDFLNYLIRQIESEMGGKSPFNRVFDGQLCNSLTCENCQGTFSILSPFTSVDLELSSSLKRSLEHFTAQEKLSQVQECTYCYKQTRRIKRVLFSSCPKFLMFRIKRFRDLPYPHKVSSDFKLRKKFNVNEYSYEDASYNLIGLVIHTGTYESGKFSAICKRSKNWYYFKDSKVSKFHSDELLDQSPYILLYKRIT